MEISEENPARIKKRMPFTADNLVGFTCWTCCTIRADQPDTEPSKSTHTQNLKSGLLINEVYYLEE
jgi:hypothetical protein